MLCIKVRLKDAQKTLEKIVQYGLIDKNYKIEKDEDFVYIPISKKSSKDENFVFVPLSEKLKGIKKFKLIKKRGKKNTRRPTSINQVLKKHLSKKELEKITKSFDVLGSIAIVDIPNDLKEKEKLIANAFMQLNPAIKTVVKKYGPISGKLRTRKVKHIIGKKTKETLYKENECVFKLNVESVYFSTRLSHERKRISSLVKNNEKILALFAGVGPFPIVIAKQKPKCEIVAIELNKEGIKYMKENIKLNKISNIKPILGDAKIKSKKYSNWADRVLMPLPMSSHEFLEVAIKSVQNGGIIHFYNFVERDQAFKIAKKRIKKACKKQKVNFKILRKKVIRSFSAKIVQIVVDFKIFK